MNEKNGREYREEMELRIKGSLLLLLGVVVTLVFLDMIATILSKAGVMGVVYVVPLCASHYFFILPRMRDGWRKKRQAQDIRKRRQARLPRK